jgi:hypothetical protein
MDNRTTLSAGYGEIASAWPVNAPRPVRASSKPSERVRLSAQRQEDAIWL